MTRIIAGERKGMQLRNPKGKSIRPTTDRTKEWIFSVLFDVQNARVLDLFCGAGNLGLEALSRGAARCSFVDRATASVKLTGQNIQRAKYADRATTVHTDVFRFLQHHPDEFDLIFADPPYRYPETDRLLALVLPWLSSAGRFVFESDAPYGDTLPEQMIELRTKSLGTTTVTIYGKM